MLSFFVMWQAVFVIVLDLLYDWSQFELVCAVFLSLFSCPYDIGKCCGKKGGFVNVV